MNFKFTYLTILFLVQTILNARGDGRANYLGCFEDQDKRDLAYYSDSEFQTIDNCIELCENLGYPYAGLQSGFKCYCGNFFGKYNKLDDDECQSSCYGNPDENCGGNMRNSIYKTNQPFEDKHFPKGYLGCFADTDDRDLGLTFGHDEQTIEKCVAFCADKGYPYAGLQSSNLCFCGNFYGKYEKEEDRECSLNCAGNRNQSCGGLLRNSVYKTSIPQKNLSFPKNYLGCYEDRYEDRDMYSYTIMEDLTVSKCIDLCKSEGYSYAGLQSGDQCFCDNIYGRYEQKDDRDCDFNCVGNFDQLCGGFFKNSVYLVDE